MNDERNESTIEVPVGVLRGIHEGTIRLAYVSGGYGDQPARIGVDGGGRPANRDAAVAAFEEEFGPQDDTTPPGSPNPKDAEARRTGKVRLDLLEPVAEREIAKALAFGADKYGVRNFVTAPINARVYVAAMKRHIDAWLEGEDHADDSGAHHLGHIGANVHVALAAIAAGTFVDDRQATAAKDASISDPAKVEG